MKRNISTLFVLLFFAAFASGQEPAVSVQKNIRLIDAFKNGHFQGSFRTFFMATDNTRNLSDYYALAAGGGLKFNTAAWHGFSMGIGGVFNFNLASSDLSAIDSTTGAKNRYESGLFDVENANNKKDLDRMEEFWLRYAHGKTKFTFGKQLLQTPFVNFQDGRMRPTAESGVWLENTRFKNIKIEGGWIWKISPRSTVRWYSVAESIGIYPKGLNPDGTGSGYPENLKSKGIAIAGMKYQWRKNTQLQVWDQLVENIFNTGFAQIDHKIPLKNGLNWVLGLQFTHQNAVAFGGNEIPSKSYFQKDAQSNVISLQTGAQKKQWSALAAYTRVTGDGRFLSPREWGREPFYTFMSRERIEGSGNSHSVTGRINWQNKAQKLRIDAAYGIFLLPDVKDAQMNKYSFPSYNQFNLDIRYDFSKALEGLQAQFLLVRKGRLGDVYGNDKWVINRVNMLQYNIILNYSY